MFALAVGLVTMTGPFLMSQEPSQTVTDSEGTKLTFRADGITSVSKDGTTRHLPAAWLNENCSDPSKTGLTDANDLADLKIVCQDWAQFNNQAENGDSILEPPTAAPDDCPITQIALVSTRGQSDAYKFLAYQIAALDAGHEGQRADQIALNSMKADPSADPITMLTDVFRGFDIATNKFYCGAFFVGQYHANGQVRQVARITLVSVYNRLAILNDRTKAYVEGRFKGPEDPDANTVLENANTLTALTDKRNAALSDLLSTTQMSALLSLYTGDKSASVVDTLNMSAAEREQLLIQLNRVLGLGPPDDFTKDAELLKDFLTHHPKVRN